MSTKARLADALASAGAPADLIARAEAGDYDDYESDLATPINRLVADCLAHGLTDLAERAKSGEFDGTLEEGEAWYHQRFSGT